MTLRSSIRNFDSKVTSWVDNIFSHTAWRSMFPVITALGDPVTIIVLTAVIISVGLFYGSMVVILSGVIVPVTVTIGAIIKLLFERARPVSEYSAKLGTFSFPSGHSSGSMIAYGLLAYFAYMKLPGIWGVVITILLLIVPIGVGTSRVYLRAHYPSDVVAGWLLGIIGLIAIIFGVKPF